MSAAAGKGKAREMIKALKTATSVTVPLPVVGEIEAAVQAFVTLEPYAQRGVMALIHHFRKAGATAPQRTPQATPKQSCK